MIIPTDKSIMFIEEFGTISQEVYDTLSASFKDAVTFGCGTFIFTDIGPKHIEYSEMFDPDRW